MNAQKNSLIACAALVLALVASASPAWANLVMDPSFEDITAPFTLPGLGGVVGPPFVPGFWGGEISTVVTTENNVVPQCDAQMLKMEDEGGVVTQAFQAVYVGADSVCIDAGLARIALRAAFNTIEVPGISPVEGGVSAFFYNCATCWGAVVPYISAPINLDNNPGTWEPSLVAGVIPPGTRWVLVQTGFVNATLLGRPGYVDCVDMEVDTSSCSPSPADAVSWGQIKELYK